MSVLDTADLSEIGATLAAVAPLGVRTGCRPISGSDLATLHPEEAPAVAAARPPAA